MSQAPQPQPEPQPEAQPETKQGFRRTGASTRDGSLGVLTQPPPSTSNDD